MFAAMCPKKERAWVWLRHHLLQKWIAPPKIFRRLLRRIISSVSEPICKVQPSSFSSCTGVSPARFLHCWKKHQRRTEKERWRPRRSQRSQLPKRRLQRRCARQVSSIAGLAQPTTKQSKYNQSWLAPQRCQRKNDLCCIWQSCRLLRFLGPPPPFGHSIKARTFSTSLLSSTRSFLEKPLLC